MAVFETWLQSDLKKPVKVKQLQGNMFSADNGGNLIGVEVTDEGSPASLSGSVYGYVIRADGATVVVEGTLSENKASITLPTSCYVVVGQISIVIKVGTTTVGACTGYVYRTTTDTIVDPGSVVPSLAELLEKIADCEAATTAANNAATNANAKAGLANDAATLANTEAGLANTAAENANNKATLANNAAAKIDNMTATASGLPAGASPTVSVTEDATDHHKIVSFGIPKGDPGDATIDDTAGIGDDDLVYSADKVRKELDAKAPVVDVPITTPASVQSFPDGADDLPMALKVAVEPVQDLHGYDNPWPAGGGKNLYPFTVAKAKQYSTTGTWSGNVYTVNGITFTMQTDSDGNLIGVDVNGTASADAIMKFGDASDLFKLASGNNVSLTVSCGVVDSNSFRNQIDIYQDGTYTKTIQNGEVQYPTHVFSGDSISAGVARLMIVSGSTINHQVFKPMVCLSSAQNPTTFAPYSNICPISGWTGAEVTRTGKNILKPTGFVQGALPWNGNNADTIGSSNKVITSEYICVKGLNTVTLKAWKGNIVRWYEVDKDKRFLSYLMNAPHEGDSYTFQLHEGCEYIRLSIGFDSTNVAPSGYGTDVYAQIEAGSTATAYEPYKGEQYQIAFPSGAGTVYGGTLTLNQDGTGSLVVDRAKNTYSGDWSYASSTGVLYVDNTATDGKIAETLSNTYPYGGVINGTNEAVYAPKSICVQAINGVRFAIYDTDYTSADQFNTHLSSNPLEIVYQLATPVAYTLTPGQVKTLLGLNNVWADTGDILSVEYSADTKLYVDQQIAEKVSASQRLMELIVTANREDTMTATKAYSSGDLLIVNGTLYKASTSIANGATLTEGTNVTATTVAAEIAALAQK